jgi:hypothetical protein
MHQNMTEELSLMLKSVVLDFYNLTGVMLICRDDTIENWSDPMAGYTELKRLRGSA